MTPEQRNAARHALGLDGVRRQSYRNRYFSMPGGYKHEVWSQLVEQGDAMIDKNPHGPMTHFYLTRQGAEKALEPGETLDPEDFPQ